MPILSEFHDDQKDYKAAKTKLEGVEILDLKPWADERGFFLELSRKQVTDKGNPAQAPLVEFWQEVDLNKAQWSMSQVDAEAYIKGLHYHLKQTDIWFCPAPSKLKVVLLDAREDSKTAGQTQTVILGKDNFKLLKIPPGVAHGYKALTNPANLIYCTTVPFNPSDPDEYRIAWDHEKVRDLWDVKNG
ncbi:MAG: dTDP-4-dehydrorhamnose 3,5-epimerase family protein [Candidatus Gracilibacteria bacterium]|nr:dTDP-4-dehydrorhamnose 3,5-epimerase family protein [Candidatus Gracilibacteria bacterium]